MSRLIVVSNRVANARDAASAGGLAIAMLAALKERGGLWFGWSGKTSDTDEAPQIAAQGRMQTATLTLRPEDFDAYYNGYANSALWPLFHHRLDLANFQRHHYQGYRRVNEIFADHLARLVAPDDLVWVHDYHLIPLAEELRARGLKNRIGFFLHIPWPVPELFTALPQAQRLARALCAYDLVGFQTRRDTRAFERFLLEEAQGVRREDGRIGVYGQAVAAQAFPIGIDLDDIAAQAGPSYDDEATQKLIRSLLGRKLVIGVDRLDYSKGLPERFEAFGLCLEMRPEWRKAISYVQIAPTSRGDVREYQVIRRRLESLAGHINGQYADVDWTPIRYMNRPVARRRLLGFYRAAKVGLVTPLRDGMNLVAKEYVAAQDADDPGVLVLSRFAGAAEELAEGAIIVNPYDTEAMAEGIARALSLSREERQARHRTMMQILRGNDLNHWRGAFLSALVNRS